MSRTARTSVQELPHQGRIIVSILNKTGKSQKWLADQCGVTIGMINHIVTGYSLPSLPVAIKLARALNSTVDDIFCEKL